MRPAILIPLLLAACGDVTAGYNILAVFPIPSRSHNTLGKGVVQALLEAGHSVTWITPYPDNKLQHNLTLIDVSEVQDITANINMMEETNRGRTVGPAMVKQMSTNITLQLLRSPAVREALLNQQFDVVVSEWFFTEVQAGFAAINGCPWVLLSGMVMQPLVEYLVDGMSSPAVVPFMMHDFPVPMGFVQRVRNTLLTALMLATHLFNDLPATEELYHELFGPLAAARGVPLPPFPRAVHDVAILFVNSHPALAHAQSLPPNVIDVAGYHLDETTPPLPKDLQALLDSSPRGVIYFSMGSVLKSASFPPETRRALLAVFSKVPCTVLWKFEEQLDGLPDNVHVRPWMPQQSILAHPNTRLFITHGGMLSCIEAVHFGVPLLAVPMFGDQPSNAARAERRGYALTVPYSAQMAPELESALNRMLGDESYLKTAKRLSGYFRSRPVTPRKLIAHYTELAIQTGGAHHLRSKAMLYPWYQRLLLDQLAVLLAIIATLVLLLKKLVNSLRKKENGAKKVKKN